MATAARSLNLVNRFRLRELKRAVPLEASTSAARVAVTNPFLPHLNPESGCWAPPRYSRRRQADLIKQARKEGNLHLLPPGPKLQPREIPLPPPLAPADEVAVAAASSIDLQQPIQWIGDVKIRDPVGANVGNRLYAGKKQMFKGHKWERVIRRKRKYRRILMRHMKRRIQKWRLYHVTRKPWPLSAIRGKSGKSHFVPF
ncbi:hypothetical protein BU17DRAFT_101652 [Hysterangium stoloniferum]|nr:hypothetical protein BU17DRAFT_101652 [Hysterangium stoloniferum]